MLESGVNAVRSFTPKWVDYRPHVSKLCIRHLPVNEKLIIRVNVTSHPKHSMHKHKHAKREVATVRGKDKCTFLRKNKDVTLQ